MIRHGQATWLLLGKWWLPSPFSMKSPMRLLPSHQSNNSIHFFCCHTHAIRNTMYCLCLNSHAPLFYKTVKKTFQYLPHLLFQRYVFYFCSSAELLMQDKVIFADICYLNCLLGDTGEVYYSAMIYIFFTSLKKM